MSDIESKIAEQQSIVHQIRELQEKERGLRLNILEDLFGMDNVGSIKTSIGNLLVTGEYGLTYKFDQEGLDEAIKMGLLSEESLNAIRVKYELDKRVYDNLPEEYSEELASYLTIKPAMPTLKIKAETAED